MRMTRASSLGRAFGANEVAAAGIDAGERKEFSRVGARFGEDRYQPLRQVERQ